MQKIVTCLFILFCFLSHIAIAQPKMDHTTFDLWNKVDKRLISNNGDWVVYTLKPGKGDPVTTIYNTRNGKSFSYQRADQAAIDFENQFVCFVQHPAEAIVEDLKRAKTKEKDLPKDSLGILNLLTNKLVVIPNVKSFKLPKKTGGALAYQLGETEAPVILEKLEVKKKRRKRGMIKGEIANKKTRKNGKDNGWIVNVLNYNSNVTKQFKYITEYHFSDKNSKLLLLSTGSELVENSELKIFDVNQNTISLIDNTQAKFSKLTISSNGENVSYLLNRDTTEMEIAPVELYQWSNSSNSTMLISGHTADYMPKDWILSEDQKLIYSDDNARLFFGIRPKPILQDTSLLDSELVNVEIWSHTDQTLYTRQENDYDKEMKRAYDCVYDINRKKVLQLSDTNVPDLRYNQDRNQNLAVGINDQHYQKIVSWEGHDYNDVYLVNILTGKNELVLEKLHGNARLSPAGKYLYWFSPPESVWYSMDTQSKKIIKLTDATKHICFDELNDAPNYPRNYGSAYWTKEDEAFVVNDRYDLWSLDPSGEIEPYKLTEGRTEKIVHRYVALDREIKAIPRDSTLLIYLHNEKDKSEGFAKLNLDDQMLEMLILEPMKFSRRIIKAKNTSDLVFTKESFEHFPDLLHANKYDFKSAKKISNANPQQENYDWGSASLTSWVGPNDLEYQGLLFFPQDFDPSKKYPLLVNFYERSSHGLHNHRAPFPHRSTINYTYYLNKGYIIFNPDIHYRVGEPGESCVDAVLSGVNSILSKGFIDESNMGVQGHSWGGYQIAHLLTRTNIFKCAESGAPVVNMVSAYGGIRWGSGRSRMFQYEHTQSRLGASLWENPKVYLDNSPIFNLDKMTTPVLILHNDKDGAVPWYQGIEYFVALRRLEKEAWLLNYNDEPHWPVKRQNRIDFNRRMEQFFDHYLMDKPMPDWMKNGIPAIEKGINSGY